MNRLSINYQNKIKGCDIFGNRKKYYNETI